MPSSQPRANDCGRSRSLRTNSSESLSRHFPVPALNLAGIGGGSGDALASVYIGQIIFFENKAALDQFTSGNFEFGADVNAVAIRSGVSGSAGTSGATGTASTAKHAASGAKYYKGMAIFTVVKGGAMVQATVGGQKFSYKAVSGT